MKFLDASVRKHFQRGWALAVDWGGRDKKILCNFFSQQWKFARVVLPPSIGIFIVIRAGLLNEHAVPPYFKQNLIFSRRLLVFFLSDSFLFRMEFSSAESFSRETFLSTIFWHTLPPVVVRKDVLQKGETWVKEGGNSYSFVGEPSGELFSGLLQ